MLLDADDQASQQEVEISREFVLPLSNSESWYGPFDVGCAVMAVFPNTTTFYSGKVIRQIPRKGTQRSWGAAKNKEMDYIIQFDDDVVNPDGTKPQHQVQGELVTEY